MSILQQGKVRRNPVGRHKCPKCGTLFELVLSDLATLTIHKPSDRPDSDSYIDCPGGCQGWVLLNGIGDEPPAP